MLILRVPPPPPSPNHRPGSLTVQFQYSLIWCFFGKKGPYCIVILGQILKKHLFIRLVYSSLILTQTTKFVDLGSGQWEDLLTGITCIIRYLRHLKYLQQPLKTNLLIWCFCETRLAALAFSMALGDPKGEQKLWVSNSLRSLIK